MASIEKNSSQKRYPNRQFLNSGMPILDIRTPGEWLRTGIIKDSIVMMAFDEQGHFDAERFLYQLDQRIAKGTRFAIICRTGRRTKVLAAYLSDLGYDVIDLTGGILYMIEHELPLEPYDGD